jgi:pimeloyl-ACP methyl ester carboxylesterase
VRIGLLTAGVGPPLLLVHGGFGQIERWEPVWALLVDDWRVTAMDRRGRGSSGDSDAYDIRLEYDDIAAVAALLANEAGGPIHIFAHSYGATCALGAANRGGSIRHMILYEPPGAETVPLEWVARVTALVAAGKAGAAMVSFLSEVLGLSTEEIEVLRRTPVRYDILSVVAATLPREAKALTSIDLLAEARTLPCPITVLTGAQSPSWAGTIAGAVAEAAPVADVAVLAGVGHEAIGAAPDVIVRHLRRRLCD